jgi:hypothetical protein
MAHEDSRSVRYELIDRAGNVYDTFNTAGNAAAMAKHLWPDQEQDPDRTGNGWDIQIAGAK